MRNRTQKPSLAENAAEHKVQTYLITRIEGSAIKSGANKIQQLTNKATRLKSLFFLIDSNRKTIETNLTFKHIVPISALIEEPVIKFQKMKVAQ